MDHSVSATKTSTAATTSPNSITQLLDRLTQVSSKRQPTVGIDFFQTADQRTAIVYIPGTQTLGLGGGSNPLDLQSNILAMQSHGVAASERAVLEAMNQAGIVATDEVIFVGHSQGGMVAGNLAQHPAGYITAGLVTIGAPIAQLKLTKVPVMAIEHVNDPIPNASGRANPLTKNWVTIQRTSLASESDAPMHSHSLQSYKNTTQEVDASKSKGIVNIKQQLLSQVQGAPIGKAMDFVISREF
jgi:pimeloyl-ACP methyl ester carboxylesterase